MRTTVRNQNQMQGRITNIPYEGIKIMINGYKYGEKLGIINESVWHFQCK